MASFDSLTADIAALRAEVKSLTKLVRKVRAHQEDPTGEKTKKRTRNNGFNRQMEITDKLRKFLEIGPEETISRSEVTRRINTYIKVNGLKHPDNGRVIVLDAKLTDLLTPPAGEQITFLNIQKFISPHYIKAAEVQPEPEEDKPDEPPAPDVESPKKAPAKRPKVGKAKA
jgi:chromatin remodeling complex protein RSC6